MPPYWQTFLEQHYLVGRELSIPVQSDLSGVGAVIEIFDEREIEIVLKDYRELATYADTNLHYSAPRGNVAVKIVASSARGRRTPVVRQKIYEL